MFREGVYRRCLEREFIGDIFRGGVRYLEGELGDI